ncbi:MAG: SURF1 family protein [Kineosporiaceae bacterium]|nr:SURF1 family protein [Kineosporiaceae bacterium]
MITAADLLGALRLLRERGWLIGLLGVILASIAFVQLGEWQHHRYAAKVERNRWIDANYDAPPVPLGSVLPTPATPLAVERQWQPVRVQGIYEPFAQLLVRNRPLGNDPGFEVLVPLRLADGSAFLIDRGWLPTGSTGGLPDVVPAPPSGTVEVIAHLRPPEPSLDRVAPQGQVWRIDPVAIEAGMHGPVYSAFGVLASESPAPPGGASGAPALLPRPDEDLGPHLGYAWQWWMFTVVGYGVLGYYMVREARQRSGNPEPLRWRLPVASGSRGRSGRELTDEEWEDAAGR